MFNKKEDVQNNTKIIDLVCGMEINPSEAKYVSEYRGNKYYFCSESCKKTFDSNPEKYTSNI